MSRERLDAAVATEIARLRGDVTRLEKEKAALEGQLEQVQKENREFATMAVEAQEQNVAATNLYVASHRLTLDADEVLNIIKQIFVELVGAEELLPSRSIPMGEGVIGEVTASRQPFFFERDTPLAQEARLPMAAIPLTMNDEPVGVIVIYKLFDQKTGLFAHRPPGARASGRTRRDRPCERSASCAVDRNLKTVEGFVQLMKSQ